MYESLRFDIIQLLMKNLLLIIQIVTSVILVTLILLQAKGVGLGRAWGGGGEFYKSKRGVEKLIFRATIIIASIFFFSSIANLVL